MADVRHCVRRVALFALVGLALGCGTVCAQSAPPQGNPPTKNDVVVDVRVVGNQSVKLQRISPMIRTRSGRNYDPDIIEDDVRKLNKSRMFVSVNTSYQRTPEGVIVIFQLVERPTLRYVRYPGATLMRGTLEKQSGLKVGDAVDPYLVEEARRKLEEYYKSKGFAKARVIVSEGNKPGDRGAVFMVHEGPKQKIYNIEFEGNTIADDRRLRTQITSKTPILYLFRGEVDDAKIDEDVEKLTAYYRSLGFFSAKIGREVEFGESGHWATLRFMINEGPRYRVRNVSIIGARKFQTAELQQKLQLLSGNFFDQGTMQRDVTGIQDKYGSQGYVYCNVQPDLRFQETMGELDLVYQIEEGAKYHVGTVRVHIEGDDPHTRVNTVLNRVEVRPNDIVDIRKIRDSERRLQASGLFQTNPAQGNPPKITWSVPEDDTIMAGRDAPPGDRNFRGQSPDAAPETPLGFGNPFYVFRRRTVEDEPPVIEPTGVRFQSPAGSTSNGGFGSSAPTYGQVPLGSAAPRTATQVAQAPTYTAPNYTAPTQSYPPPAYTAPAPVYTTPNSAPVAATAPPVVQAVPQPYMGNAPSFAGAPPGVAPAYGAPVQGYGSGNDLFGQTPPPVTPYDEPTRPLDLDVNVAEAQTGRFMLGVGVNSNAGLLGSIILDEQNADITRLPTSWRDFIEGRAFRGAGQQVRLEAVPGTQVSRYSAIFRQPYLFDTRVQFGLSGYYFQRYYQNWKEERLGGRIQLGYQFPHIPDLSVSGALRMENIDISNPSVPTPPQLTRVLGNNFLSVAEFAITHDTRDNLFLATQGHRILLGYDQGFGDYDFPRVTLEGRQHFMLHERPDRSGRHVLTLLSQLGYQGNNAPIFENYFAGGFSSLRGFNFRGVGPYQQGMNVGGVFQWLNTVEYMFPISADDMIRGVLFCDYGTVEDQVQIKGNNFRVAPGFGLRITVPAMGPAPIALDFAVPVHHGPGDNIQNFAFYVGFGR
jgi:outer membrane protein insertion porin family